jgi:hypothetical protein
VLGKNFVGLITTSCGRRRPYAGPCAAQVAFDLVVRFQDFTDLADVILVQRVRDLVLLEPGLRADVCRDLRADAVDVLKGDHKVLATGDINACDACHVWCLFLN